MLLISNYHPKQGRGKEAYSKKIQYLQEIIPHMNILNHLPVPQLSLLSIPKAANSNFKANPRFQLETRGLVPSGFRELLEVVRRGAAGRPLSRSWITNPKTPTTPHRTHKGVYCLDCTGHRKCRGPKPALGEAASLLPGRTDGRRRNFVTLSTRRHSPAQKHQARGGGGEPGNVPSARIKLQNHLLSGRGTTDASTDLISIHAADPWHLSLGVFMPKDLLRGLTMNRHHRGLGGLRPSFSTEALTALHKK